MVNRAGSGVLRRVRDNINANDSSFIPGTDAASLDTYSVAVPVEARGSIAHIIVDITGASTSWALAVHAFGLIGEGKIVGSSNGLMWVYLGTLNAGSTISLANLPSTVDATLTSLAYGQQGFHVAGYSRIAFTINNVANLTNADIFVMFEK